MLFPERPPGFPRPPDIMPVPARPSLGITVRAAGRDLRASPPRIEGVVGPLDCRLLAHNSVLTIYAENGLSPTGSYSDLRRLSPPQLHAVQHTSTAVLICQPF
jgi:hypothetical protein